MCKKYMINRRNFIKQSSLAGLAPVFASFPKTFLHTEGDFIFQSPFIKASVSKSYPSFSFFSTDSLGKSQFDTSPLFEVKKAAVYKSRLRKNAIDYFIDNKAKNPAWSFEFSNREIKIRSSYSDGFKVEPLLISFSQKLNHCTALGYFSEDGGLKFPCVLHFPGLGSFRVYCSKPGITLGYKAELTDKPFVNISFPSADRNNQNITYTLKSVAVYPNHPEIKNNNLYDGLKKNYINIFQLSPGFQLLANNSTSDACAFTLFLYAEMARRTPELVEGLTAFDLIRETCNRYLNGFIGYGMVGKLNWHSKFNSSDSFPSLVMAACYYILETKDHKWAKENYKGICNWADQMIATDRNGDGIIEYGYSGNADSWNGDMRPANWWDTIGFGHDDAYSNALAYRSAVLLSEVSNKIGVAADADRYKKFAQKLKANYYKNFYNEKTGVLAGWKSEDGKLHDYYFTFVNSIAVCYGLVAAEQGKQLMLALLKKMKDVDYNNFRLGLPGNLIPIRREDYIHFDRRWGYGKDEEGRDGFQIYENGGATGCYAYYTIMALKMVGLKKESDAILLPMLEGFRNGDFEGHCPGTDMTKDWKTWKGECWGYEGFLVDNYLTFLSVVEDNVKAY